jgi:hypothetical protein
VPRTAPTGQLVVPDDMLQPSHDDLCRCMKLSQRQAASFSRPRSACRCYHGRRERPLEQRRTSGVRTPKSSRVRRSPIRAKIIRFWHAERRESTQTQSSMSNSVLFKIALRHLPALHACNLPLVDLPFPPKSMSAALRGTDVPKPNDFGTDGRPVHSARFGCPYSAGPPLLQRSLSGPPPTRRTGNALVKAAGIP